jgi:hypothetical protein
VDKIKVAIAIEIDVLDGVYSMFEVLESKLSYIATKLRESNTVINSSKELTPGEIRTLVDHEYIEKSYDQGERHSHDFFYDEFY